MARFGEIGKQYFDDAGDPLINGKLFFYESGTNTPKDTYADTNQTIVNTNPVILTAAGRQPNIFFTGSARVVLTSSDDVQIEVRDPEGAGSGAEGFGSWDISTIYNVPDIVVGSDDKFYISITNGNQGNDPLSSPSDWTEVRFIRQWNTNESYSVGQVVGASNGYLYKSNTSANQGNDPISDAVNWDPAVNEFLNDKFIENNVTIADSKALFLGTDNDFSMAFSGATTVFGMNTGALSVNNAIAQTIFACDQDICFFFYQGALKANTSSGGFNIDGLNFVTGDVYEQSTLLKSRYPRMDAPLNKTSANNGETLTEGDNINADTSGAAFTLNLPASPSVGDKCWFRDANGTWAANNLTVGRNGNNIINSATDLVCNTNNLAFCLMFTDYGWLFV